MTDMRCTCSMVSLPATDNQSPSERLNGKLGEPSLLLLSSARQPLHRQGEPKRAALSATAQARARLMDARERAWRRREREREREGERGEWYPRVHAARHPERCDATSPAFPIRAT
ncbi:hypothetical protein NHX12_013676 [Muraenolepis orangiensis]|uniref:Uncharacterized protein n=1 Tax=Muraenolepis orangiensis TaxID=630683 RepID=A0A9Q0I4V4_9TELE|nr:hypothetical protein NHX12_013676 [Muraenolepis orangiensis]